VSVVVVMIRWMVTKVGAIIVFMIKIDSDDSLCFVSC
jgi:hypothetical protein